MCCLGGKIAVWSLLRVVHMPIVPRTSVPKLFSGKDHRTLSVKIHELEKILLTKLSH